MSGRAAGIIDAIRNDTRRGASELVRDALAAFTATIDDAAPSSPLQPQLDRTARALVDAQPAMAPLLALACTVLRGTAGTTPDRTTDAAKQAVLEFAARLDRIAREVPERADALIPAGGRVLTLSSSATVRRALALAAARRTFDVVCLEGRPALEGREMAAQLAERGIPVVVAVDAALGSVMRDSDVVLVGADSIGDLGIVNKIGTRAAALLARRTGVPIYAIADSTKLLPAGWPQELDGDRATSEVWPDAPAGVSIWNRYFETTPLAWFDGVVTEDGLRSEADVEMQRTRLHVPATLRDAA